MRTFNEILTEATDSANKGDMLNVDRCWKELVLNKKKYPLVQMLYAKEYFHDLARQIARQDIENSDFLKIVNKLLNE